MKWKYSDFEKTPELSPDLEWMVQSGQVSRQMFLETLAKNYYSPVYRLALSLLNDISAARVACRDIFSKVVHSTHSYRDQGGMDAWLYQIACQTIRTAMRRESFWRGFEEVIRLPGQFTDPLKQQPATEMDRLIWQQVDGLGEEQRILTMLHFANGWEISQIANILGIAQVRVQEHLESSLDQIKVFLGDQEESPENKLRTALQQRYPLPEPTEGEIRQFTQKVEHHLGKRRILGKGATTTREIVILGIALLVVILAIWGGNHFLFRSESDADSPGSWLDGGGMGLILEWVGLPLSSGGEEQAEVENPLSILEQWVNPMQLGGASDVLLMTVSENRVTRSAIEISVGRYSAFENKDRIRRLRRSQPVENIIIPTTHLPQPR